MLIPIMATVIMANFLILSRDYRIAFATSYLDPKVLISFATATGDSVIIRVHVSKKSFDLVVAKVQPHQVGKQLKYSPDRQGCDPVAL